MAIDINVLKTELTTDPKSLGLPALDDYRASDKLNEVGASGETIQPEYRQSWELQAAVVISEFELLTAEKQRAWLAIVGLSSREGEGIPIRNTNLRSQIAGIWTAGTTTRNNLLTLQTRPASRAEVLFGENTTVGFIDVHKARRI